MTCRAIYARPCRPVSSYLWAGSKLNDMNVPHTGPHMSKAGASTRPLLSSTCADSVTKTNPHIQQKVLNLSCKVNELSLKPTNVSHKKCLI